MEEYHFPLYDTLVESVKDKKSRNIEIIRDKLSLFLNISNQDKNTAEIIYLLILHYYLKKEKYTPQQLTGKITFFKQKTMINNRGVIFSDFKEIQVLEIIHEFLELISENK